MKLFSVNRVPTDDQPWEDSVQKHSVTVKNIEFSKSHTAVSINVSLLVWSAETSGHFKVSGPSLLVSIS